MAIMQLIKTRKNWGSVGNVLQIFASNVFILGINVLTGIMIARYLGPEGRGEQAAIIMWPQFLAYCLTLGIPSALVYYMKKKDGNQGSLYITALYMSVILGCAAIVIGAFLIPFWMKGYSQEVIEFATWALVMSPIAMIGTVNTATLQSREEFHLYNVSRYFPLIGTLILLLGLVTIGHVTPFYTSVAYLFPVLPIALWITFKLVSQYKVSQSNKFTSGKKLLSYGIRSYGTDVAGTLSGYIDQILVVGLLSPASLGLYVVSLNLSKILNTIQNAITSVLFPKASGLQHTEAIQLTFKVYRISTLVTIIVGAGVFLVAPYLLILLYGQSFADAVPIFRILIFQTAITSLSWILSQGFMSTGKPGVVTIIRMSTLGLNIVLLNILIPLLGTEGAAISLLITSVVEFTVIFLVYTLNNHIKLRDFIVSKKDISWLLQRFRSQRLQLKEK
ncbi:oligosaccharide flippase family protein [Paenibacillus sp. N3/727]|uniref:oligosaccharide flippase family protein n=1 Tax=Paenibacillus sp. N3/727 TaxID=2925845 RepID=UPI001F53967C|nr:oligosaccharide flippase family protein [Paenibacillus sp. N3/727]UNK18766.1 oligosaccharide flippase family protein [Paenibacillus sp. N3/727]